MARLALVAMLALVLVPSIGRIAQHFDSSVSINETSLGPAFGAMCTAQGLAYDPAVAAIEAIGFALQGSDDSRGPAPPHAGDDCDYCTIAVSSIVPVFLSLVAPALTSDITLPSRNSRMSTWRYPLGLGSRGPPLTA